MSGFVPWTLATGLGLALGIAVALGEHLDQPAGFGELTGRHEGSESRNQLPKPVPNVYNVTFIGAGLQAQDALVLVAAGGEDDHGQGRAVHPDALADREAVEVGQREVEEPHADTVAFDREIGGTIDRDDRLDHVDRRTDSRRPVNLFGAKRIPEMGKSLGQGIRGFKKELKGDDEKGENSSEQKDGDTTSQ